MPYQRSGRKEFDTKWSGIIAFGFPAEATEIQIIGIVRNLVNKFRIRTALCVIVVNIINRRAFSLSFKTDADFAVQLLCFLKSISQLNRYSKVIKRLYAVLKPTLKTKDH